MPDTSQACNVPAFRYAMERWPADSYQVVVYRRPGPQPAFDLLRKGVLKRSGAANYSLKSIDVTEPEGKALAEQRSIAAFPWVEVYYPVHSEVQMPVWSGPLTSDRAGRIMNSPGRSRLAQKLLSGDVAVWILIGSGHHERDRRVREVLKASLERASATLRIPEAGIDANGNPVAVTDFRTYPVRFSIMEIAHDDPDEDLLVSALLKSEPDLGRYAEPMAFPVFGRGRALYALVGNGIQEKNIREACQSMVGWCTCEIKAASPGTDLLISADWSRPFGGRMVKDPELPLTGISSFLQNRKPSKTVLPRPTPEGAESSALCKITPPVRRASAPEPPPRPAGSPLVRNLLYLAGAAGALLLALSVLLTVKTKR